MKGRKIKGNRTEIRMEKEEKRGNLAWTRMKERRK